MLDPGTLGRIVPILALLGCRGPKVEPPPLQIELSATDEGYSAAELVAAPRATLIVSNADADTVHTFHLRDGQGRTIQNLAVPPGTGPLTWTLPDAGVVVVTSDHFATHEATIRIVQSE